MRAGVVASIRINPRDCQSVLDLIELVGIPKTGMSFSQMASLALSSLLETQREAQHLPEPDEFQFANRMGPYRGKKQNGLKTAVTNHVYGQGSKVRAPALPQEVRNRPAPAFSETSSSHGVVVAEQTADQREAGVRLSELLQKKELSDEHPGVVWSAGDEQEFQQLYAVVYPEG